MGSRRAALVAALAVAGVFVILSLGRHAAPPGPPGPPAPHADGRRNLLLLSLDTLRPDHLGAYGYERPTSPTIDAMLAAQGVVFEHAYSSFPSTPASHMTIFTGRQPCAHGVYGGPNGVALAAGIPTLPEILRDAGWATGGFTEDAWVTAELGFSRGFEEFVENRSANFMKPEGQAGRTFGAAATWIRAQAQSGRPWFAFVHTYQVHHPYAPPPGYVERVAPDHGSDRTAASIARYDGEVRYTDDLLGPLLAAVDEGGGRDRTLVVLLSDHGEHFGEHGLFLHGFSLFEPMLHVALVLRAPGLVPAGHRVAANVGLVDVLPTVLELLGLPPEPGVQGRSLVPLLRGETLPPATQWAELPFAKLVAVREGRMKRLIDRETGEARVFDLTDDPDEAHDLGSPADVAGNRRLLADWERLCAAGRVAGPAGQSPTLDPGVRGKLEALGYAH